MTLQAERVVAEPEAEPPSLMSEQRRYQTGKLATATSVTFGRPKPRTVPSGSAAERRMLAMLRDAPAPTKDRRWYDMRNCNAADPEMFFADPGSADSEIAKAHYCKPCPVRGDCLLSVFIKPEMDGVWGGFDRNERKAAEYAELGQAMLLDAGRAKQSSPQSPQPDAAPEGSAPTVQPMETQPVQQ